MTGDFTNVTFDLPHPEIAINVPASALIFNQQGLRVATVGSNGRIVLKQVTISRDVGGEVRLDRELPRAIWSSIRRTVSRPATRSALPAPRESPSPSLRIADASHRRFLY